MKNALWYLVGTVIFGLVLSFVTLIVLDYIQYLVAGMVLTTPIYGFIRKTRNKGESLTKGLYILKSVLLKLVKPNKDSLAIWIMAFIVIYNTKESFGGAFFSTVLYSVTAFVGLAIVWESVRFIVKITKKTPFMSYGEAIKGAF